jgi:hypothetical protein
VGTTASACLARRALAALAVALLTAVAAASVGNAAPLPTSGMNGYCPGTTQYPFTPWGDRNAYILAPGGSFEGQTGWTYTGGTSAVSGNEPYKVHGASDSRSLSIPAGGSATTPWTCASLSSPTLRFFAVGGNLISTLKVDVITQTALGTVTVPVGLITAKSSWTPPPAILFLSNIAALVAPNGTIQVKFRFTALGSAAWKIDDVYVDPWKVY